MRQVKNKGFQIKNTKKVEYIRYSKGSGDWFKDETESEKDELCYFGHLMIH